MKPKRRRRSRREMKTDEKLALIWHTRVVCAMRYAFLELFFAYFNRTGPGTLTSNCTAHAQMYLCAHTHAHSTRHIAYGMQADPNPLAVSFTCFRQTQHTTHNTAYTLHYSAVMKAVSPCRTAVSAQHSFLPTPLPLSLCFQCHVPRPRSNSSESNCSSHRAQLNAAPFTFLGQIMRKKDFMSAQVGIKSDCLPTVCHQLHFSTRIGIDINYSKQCYAYAPLRRQAGTHSSSSFVASYC